MWTEHMQEMRASVPNTGLIWMVWRRLIHSVWIRTSGCLPTLIVLRYGCRCDSYHLIYIMILVFLLSPSCGSCSSSFLFSYLQNRTSLQAALGTNPVYLRNKLSDNGLVVDYKDWQIPLGRRFRFFAISVSGIITPSAFLSWHVQRRSLCHST
jgi:hypothetical protein